MGNYKNTHYLVCLYMKFPCHYIFIFVKHFSWEISALCPKFLKQLLNMPNDVKCVLRVKPKLLGAKTGSCRFPEVMEGMDSGFSSCAAPAFCHSPGILKIGRYMCVLRFARKLQGQRMRREGSGGA